MTMNEKHENELKRVSIIEKKIKQKKFIIEQARMHSTPCDTPDLLTPKECYIDSNYQCKWSIEADRCNLIENI